MSLAEELVEELDCKTVIDFYVSGYHIQIKESIVVSWIIMAVLLLGAFLLTRGFRIHNISKRQAFIEFVVTKITGIVEGMIGEEGKSFVPYLTTVIIYIGFSNIIGIFGFKSPTKDLNVTGALAIMSILIVVGATIKHKGFFKWLKSLINPINILDLFTRPLSLCMRLFGNVLGAFVVMKLVELALASVCGGYFVVVPPILSLYFDLFDGLLQAYVFVFLTSLYIKEAIE